MASLGAGAAFLTEDAIKSVLKDAPFPKEIIGGLLENAKGTKEEVVKGLKEELGKYLSRLDLNNIVDYVAENYDVDVSASFSLKKKKKNVSKKSKK